MLFFHGPTQGFPAANTYANILQDVSSFPGDVHRIFAAHSMTFTLSEGKWLSFYKLNQRLHILLMEIQRTSNGAVQSSLKTGKKTELGFKEEKHLHQVSFPSSAGTKVLQKNYQLPRAIVLPSHSGWRRLH